jgi:DNA-binding SARP family transcriptional activator
VFWPHSSQERGRRALSQALYVLRQSLGDGLVEAQGQDTISVDPSGIWCDASALEATLAECDLEGALTLYLGDLLEGFFLSDAPEFERWLDAERARLRGLAAEAAATLAQQEEAAGNPVGAARWARRRAELTPYDERAVIDLIGVLLRGGDRSGAHHEYELYRERLRTDLELEPPAEVEQALASGDVQASAYAATLGPQQELAAGRGLEAEPERREDEARTWRQPRIGAVAFVALLATGLAAYAFVSTTLTSGPNDVVAGDARPRLLVVELTNRTGDPTMAPLARLVSDWLSSEVARTGRVRVVPPLFVQQALREVEDGGDTSLLTQLLAAGYQADATLVLGGYLAGTADSARIEVAAVNPVTGEFAFVLDPIPVSATAPQDALEHLHEAVVVALSVQFDDRLGSQWMARASRPSSLESHRRYSEALDLFLVGTWAAQAEAVELFIDVWRADTTFTAPLMLALLGMMNTNQGDRADSLAHALEPKTAALPEWDRAMLRYMLAWLHGALEERYRRGREIVSLAPNSEWRILLATAVAAVGCRSEALSILEGMDSRSGFLDRSAFAYWPLRIDLRHLTGDTTGELRDASLARAELTDERYPYRALVAQIRVAARAEDLPRLERHLGAIRPLGSAARTVYLKLFYWGPLDLTPSTPEHQTMLDSAWAWLTDRPVSTRGGCANRNMEFTLLYHSQRWHEAASVVDSLLTNECWYPVYGMYRAPLAAHLGDIERARAITDSFPWQSHMGEIQLASEGFWKARVEAIAGDPAQAVAYLRMAFRRGVPYSALHENTARIDFERIWHYGPLQQLLVNRSCEN